VSSAPSLLHSAGAQDKMPVPSEVSSPYEALLQFAVWFKASVESLRSSMTAWSSNRTTYEKLVRLSVVEPQVVEHETVISDALEYVHLGSGPADPLTAVSQVLVSFSVVPWDKVITSHGPAHSTNASTLAPALISTSGVTAAVSEDRNAGALPRPAPDRSAVSNVAASVAPSAPSHANAHSALLNVSIKACTDASLMDPVLAITLTTQPIPSSTAVVSGSESVAGWVSGLASRLPLPTVLPNGVFMSLKVTQRLQCQSSNAHSAAGPNSSLRAPVTRPIAALYVAVTPFSMPLLEAASVAVDSLITLHCRLVSQHIACSRGHDKSVEMAWALRAQLHGVELALRMALREFCVLAILCYQRVGTHVPCNVKMVILQALSRLTVPLAFSRGQPQYQAPSASTADQADACFSKLSQTCAVFPRLEEQLLSSVVSHVADESGRLVSELEASKTSGDVVQCSVYTKSLLEFLVCSVQLEHVAVLSSQAQTRAQSPARAIAGGPVAPPVALLPIRQAVTARVPVVLRMVGVLHLAVSRGVLTYEDIARLDAEADAHVDEDRSATAKSSSAVTGGIGASAGVHHAGTEVLAAAGSGSRRPSVDGSGSVGVAAVTGINPVTARAAERRPSVVDCKECEDRRLELLTLPLLDLSPASTWRSVLEYHQLLKASKSHVDTSHHTMLFHVGANGNARVPDRMLALRLVPSRTLRLRMVYALLNATATVDRALPELSFTRSHRGDGDHHRRSSLDASISDVSIELNRTVSADSDADPLTSHAGGSGRGLDSAFSMFVQLVDSMIAVPARRLRGTMGSVAWSTRFKGSVHQGHAGLHGPFRESISDVCAAIRSSALNSSNIGSQRRASQAKHIGLDDGGSHRSWLFILCPNGVHSVGEDRHMLILNPSRCSPEDLKQLYVFGQLLGVAVRSETCLDLDLASVFWELLVHGWQGIVEEDLLDAGPLNATAADSFSNGSEGCGQQHRRVVHDGPSAGMLAWLASFDANAAFLLKFQSAQGLELSEAEFDALELTYTAALSDGHSSVELIPNGRLERVLWRDRNLYAKMVIMARLRESELQMQVVRSGLSSVLSTTCAANCLTLLSPADLESLVCGERLVNLAQLKEHTVYTPKQYSASHPYIRWFWSVLEEFSEEERSKFLQFAWARPRLPSDAADYMRGAGKAYRMLVCVVDGRSDAPLPTSETCFFNVKIPRYSSREVLLRKLRLAIQCRSITF